MGETVRRRWPVGAEVQEGGGTHFRLWAPASKQAAVLLEGGEAFAMRAGPGGYYSAHVEKTAAGMHYRFRVDSGDFPDPVSRCQPDGPHGASRIVDPATFQWSDGEWQGVSREGQIIYEMHIGTFTQAGNWAAATEQLAELADLGVTLLEVMPVADFPGRFGWGYDGVCMFAPTRLYGEPDDFRAFVDRAHSLGMGVILDVVYNHVGPDGNYLKEYSPDYFSRRYKNEWGEPINFDDEGSAGVREFFLMNAGYWIDEYHLDGLRLDATQQIFDASPIHILAEITRAVRAAARGRGTYIVSENEPQDIRMVLPLEKGGHGMESLWNDDFHHSAIVALTGRNEAYYMDYNGDAQELLSAIKYGYLYQGQRYKWQKARRGTASLHEHPASFVTFIQNHDQIANSIWGHRIHELTGAGHLRAITTLLLLGPNTPMLFQGQEFSAATPFLFFADHKPELALMVAQGRREFLAQFPSIASLREELEDLVSGPEREETFLRCKLDFSDRQRNARTYRLYKDLLRLRREDSVFRCPRTRGVDGAIFNRRAFVLRYFGRTPGDDRLLLINLGSDLDLNPAPEPLLAPPQSTVWKTRFCSEDPIYGGIGTAPVEGQEGWRLPAHAAVVCIPAPC